MSAYARRDKENVVRRLQRDILAEKGMDHDRDGTMAVILAGRTMESAKSLFGQDVIIRYFPFHIGRASLDMTRFKDKLDLALEEQPPLPSFTSVPDP
jgi:hypothetical protein